MDSEHRHELRDNELVKWIKNTPDFLRENLLPVIGVCCILLGLWMWWAKPLQGLKDNSQRREQSVVTDNIQKIEVEKMVAAQSGMMGQEMSTSLVNMANKIEAAGGESKNKNAAALAYIKSAEALRTDLHYANEVEREIVLDQIGKAKVLYEKAIAKAGDNPTLTGMAKFGLGLCSEEVGDYEAAGKIYAEIAADAGLEGTIFPIQAAKRVAALVDNQEKFVFVDRPEPEVPAVVEEPAEPVTEVIKDAEAPLEETAEALGQPVEEVVDVVEKVVEEVKDSGEEDKSGEKVQE